MYNSILPCFLCAPCIRLPVSMSSEYVVSACVRHSVSSWPRESLEERLAYADEMMEEIMDSADRPMEVGHSGNYKSIDHVPTCTCTLYIHMYIHAYENVHPLCEGGSHYVLYMCLGVGNLHAHVGGLLLNSHVDMYSTRTTNHNVQVHVHVCMYVCTCMYLLLIVLKVHVPNCDSYTCIYTCTSLILCGLHFTPVHIHVHVHVHD